MKALVLTGSGQIAWHDLNKPEVTAGKALVRMRAASLNRRDDWIREGKYPNIRYGGILGSDGAGIVETVGEGADQSVVGKEVVINPNIEWGPDPDVQSKRYT